MRIMKKAVVVTLFLSLLSGFVVSAYGADRTIAGLGTGVMAPPVVSFQADVPWNGSYVWLGICEEHRYRVLSANCVDFGGNTIFLDCDSVFIGVYGRQLPFNDTASNVWEGSSLQDYLNTTFLNYYYDNWEINAMANSKKTEKSEVGIGEEIK